MSFAGPLVRDRGTARCSIALDFQPANPWGAEIRALPVSWRFGAA